jgi:hypothetical protein
MMFGLQHLFCWVPRRKSSSPRKQQHRSEPEADGKRRKRRRLRRYIHAKSGSLGESAWPACLPFSCWHHWQVTMAIPHHRSDTA